jgi:hypothetical protein
MTRAVAFFLVSGVAAFGPGACSPSSDHPAVLGDCIPAGDAACASVSSGGGGGGGSGGARDSSTGPEDSGTTTPDAASYVCGADAGSLVSTANVQCAPCIATSCCQAYEECGAAAACAAIALCPSGSISSCENANPTGISGYNDLASCLAASCASVCPALPMPAPGDF